MSREGFTLLELLVVLTILGVLLMTVPTGLGALPGMRLHAAQRLLADRLRAARYQAIETGSTMIVMLDSSNLMSVGQVHSDQNRVSFFGDGSSNGAEIRVADAGREYRIHVEALTGRIAADE